MRTTSLLSLAASFSSALALYKGFNYGSTNTAGTAYTESDFESLFTTAASLDGTDDSFTSARIYTMIQGGTTDTVISAIPAALATKTYLLLGLWASGGDSGFANELSALTTAIEQFPTLSEYLVGISVGSEDLYRITATAAQQGNTDPGAQPATLVDYISQVRDAIANTAWSAAPVGHVDTWTAWANSSNDVVADACDFVGVDAYPYFQNTEANSISVGASLFTSALDSLTAAAKAKDVWITETGWPVSGETENEAVPSVANAQTYYDAVGCDIAFPSYNTWWYTLQDYGSSPSFGVVGETLSTTPLYNLTCGASSSSSSSSAAASTSTSTSAAAASTSKAATTSAAAAATTSAAAASSAAASSAAASPVEYDVTETVYTTHYVTVTASTCCVANTGIPTVTIKSTATVSITTGTASTASTTATSCPANIEGDYLSPNLIIPVSSSSPNTAYGTSYFGIVNSTVSSIFVFDIPSSYAGKECSLIFLFPELDQLETSSYTFNGVGGIESHVLASNANEDTTYSNAPAFAVENGAISSLASGNSYVISSDSCPAGSEVSFELTATNGLALNFFEDYNPSPLGLYVRAC